jgi:hypothetical protein
VSAPVQVGDLVEAELDKRSIEHLDFESVCDVQTQPIIVYDVFLTIRREGPVSPICAKPAVASIRCRGCSRMGLLCEAHRNDLVATATVECGTCKQVGPPLVQFEIRPLPRAGA